MVRESPIPASTPLADFAHLQSLSLDGDQLTDRAAASLARVEPLTELYLTGQRITDAHLAASRVSIIFGS